MQAVLDGKTLITYQALNGKTFVNVEDIMGFRTSVTSEVVESVEYAYAA